MILDSNASSSESSLHLRLIVLWHLTAQLCKCTATVHVHDGVHSMKGVPIIIQNLEIPCNLWMFYESPQECKH